MLNLIKILSLANESFEDSSQNLSINHLLVLSFVSSVKKDDDFGQKELKKSLHLSQTKTHRICSSLKRSGLLEVEPSAWDPRRRVLYLTSKGEDLAAKINNLLSEKSDASLVSEVMLSCKKAKDLYTERKALLEIKKVDVLLSRKKVIKKIFKKRGEPLVEVGRDYIKTVRGNVSLNVLLKRVNSTNVDVFINAIKTKPVQAYNELLTPTPKTKPLWQKELELHIQLRKERG